MWNKQYDFSGRTTRIHQELPCEFWSILHGHTWSQLGKEYFLLFPLGPDNGVVPRGLAQSDAWYWGLVLGREGTPLFSVAKLDVSWLHCSKPRHAWLHLGLSLSPKWGSYSENDAVTQISGYVTRVHPLDMGTILHPLVPTHWVQSHLGGNKNKYAIHYWCQHSPATNSKWLSTCAQGFWTNKSFFFSAIVPRSSILPHVNDL